MKTVLAALLVAGLLLPTAALAAEKQQGQNIQQAPDKPNMTRQYRAKRHYRTARHYRTNRYRTWRAYRAKRCDPFMRQMFGVCTTN